MDQIVDRIAQATGLRSQAIAAVITMLSDGLTIPFIARYRKESTQSMQDHEIQNVEQLFQQYTALVERRNRILTVIEEQGKMTSDLQSRIEQCWDKSELEDLYAPYKRKKQTRAEKARQHGLEPLAKMIMAQGHRGIHDLAKSFVKKEIKSIEESIQGAQDIIAEWISEHVGLRQKIRKKYRQEASIKSKVITKKKEEASKYEMYFDHQERAFKAPSHRILAMLRGEQEGLLRVKLLLDEEDLIFISKRIFIRKETRSREYIECIESSIQDALKRLLIPSLENEAKSILKDKAEHAAIQIFADNLKDLLLAPPLGSKWVMAIDPGFRTGCKTVVLDDGGNLKATINIFPHPPQNRKIEAAEEILNLMDRYPIQAVAIGDGTAGLETYRWLQKILNNKSASIYLINEDGASVYSGSALARKEFPDQDITVRGAVSIGRRLIDPLSELIKIDPKSIGVGQYQHDIQPSKLKQSLDQTIEYCVNYIGVDLNTASPTLLQYISGLGPKLAENIVAYRGEKNGFESREELLKIPKLGPKAFQLSAGFLRIKKPKNPLDATAVHPERYRLLQNIARDQGMEVSDLIQNKSKVNEIPWKNYLSNEVGWPTLEDIQKELLQPSLDPRGQALEVQFSQQINSIEDVSVGMLLNGKITNITHFGAFVNLGIKENGMIHISEITDRFIKDPRELLSIDQSVQAKVIKVDLKKKQIALSLKL